MINFTNILAQFRFGYSDLCGCKLIRPCYQKMVNTLKRDNEVACVEEASIGSSTVLVFLEAMKEYCGEFINVTWYNKTYEARPLYEVVISAPDGKNCENKPVFIIDAGQDAGTESVGLALYLIEQLVGCKESKDMIRKYRWVILPSTNPDGMEYARSRHVWWKKNVRPLAGGLSFGVDISRNFNSDWKACGADDNVFSAAYNGEKAASEIETVFIQNVIKKYKKYTKLYVSLRRDGHGLLYPHDSKKDAKTECKGVPALAGAVADKVNMRAGAIQLFHNESIFDTNGKKHCGHSLDYAVKQGINYAYEMRVFLGEDNRILLMFHALPRGHEHSLRLGYLSGFKEMFHFFDKKRDEMT